MPGESDRRSTAMQTRYWTSPDCRRGDEGPVPTDNNRGAVSNEWLPTGSPQPVVTARRPPGRSSCLA
jgi:hypothetical protein